jgi:hypothetical protein
MIRDLIAQSTSSATAFLLIALSPLAVRGQQAARIDPRVLKATVEVASGPISGSGFVVDSSRGLIVTNAHVVADDSVIVFIRPDRAVTARKIAVDTLADLALIHVHPDLTLAIPQLVLRDSTATIGESVFAIGFPLRNRITATSGMVASVGDDAVFVDALINPGNSGGPVVDASGRVIGTATFVLQDPSLGPGLGAAVSNRALLSLISNARKAQISSEAQDTISPVAPRPKWRLGWDEVRENVLKHGTVFYANWDSLRVGPFDLVISTPGSNWATWYGQDSILGIQRFQRDKKTGSSPERYSRIGTLRNWEQYIGDQLTPLVAIQINPRLSAQWSSIFGNLVLAATLGISGPLAYSFSGDVFSARLLRDGQVVHKISGGHAPQRFWIESRWLVLQDIADFGFYTFPPEAFAPRQDKTFPVIEIEVVNRKNLKSYRLRLPDVVSARIWGEFFEPFRTRFPDKQYHGVRLHHSCKEVPGFAPECREFAYIESYKN